MFNRSSGPSCNNLVDLVANFISLVDDSGKPTNIRDFFVNKGEVIKAIQTDGSWKYPPETINAESVSGLKSMINYIRATRQKRNLGIHTKTIQPLSSKRR